MALSASGHETIQCTELCPNQNCGCVTPWSIYRGMPQLIPAVRSPAPVAASPSTARAAQLAVLDNVDSGRPAGSREDEHRELQEATRRSLMEGEPAYAAADQAHLSSAWRRMSRCALLIWPGMTPTGWSVTVVASPTRATTCLTCTVWTATAGSTMTTAGSAACRGADVLGDRHQRNGYIFFYLHKDLCSQVVTAGSASCAPWSYETESACAGPCWCRRAPSLLSWATPDSTRGANWSKKFGNSEIVRIPIRYLDGQQLILSDNFE